MIATALDFATSSFIRSTTPGAVNAAIFGREHVEQLASGCCLSLPAIQGSYARQAADIGERDHQRHWLRRRRVDWVICQKANYPTRDFISSRHYPDCRTIRRCFE